MQASQPIDQTVWIARYHPLALVVCTILMLGVIVGAYLVFSHVAVHQHAKIPLVAWHWCLPALIITMLLNIKMTIKPGELRFVWRIGPVNLHEPRRLFAGAIEWHNIGNKNKTYRLGYRSPLAGYLPIVTLNRKGATMLSLNFSLISGTRPKQNTTQKYGAG